MKTFVLVVVIIVILLTIILILSRSPANTSGGIISIRVDTDPVVALGLK